jgi:hypothetical protein
MLGIQARINSLANVRVLVWMVLLAESSIRLLDLALRGIFLNAK